MFINEEAKATNQCIVFLSVLDKADKIVPDKQIFGYQDEESPEEDGTILKYPFVSNFVNKRIILDYGDTFKSDEGDCRGETIRIPKGCQFHELAVPDVPLKLNTVVQLIVGKDKLKFQITELTDPI